MDDSVQQTVLIVEDEQKIAALISDYCQHAGFNTHCLYHGDDVIPWIKENSFDILLLDLMLPGKSGLDICRELREFNAAPVIMITAKVEEVDKLLGLEIGADDYICKPFSPKEVVARVKSFLRRINQQIISPNLVSLDEDTLAAVVNGQRIELTHVEFRIFKLLTESPEKIFSRDRIMDYIYSDHRIVSDRTIDSHVKKLRHKISPAQEFELIHSVYGVGYKYSPINLS